MSVYTEAATSSILSGQADQFVVGKTGMPPISGEELGKLVCAYYGLASDRVAEVQIVMLPQELATVVITMFLAPDLLGLLAKLHAEANPE